MYAELSPVVDFREACCRQYENSECTRGGFCNFMHLKPVSIVLKRELFEAQKESIKILNPRPDEALREQKLRGERTRPGVARTPLYPEGTGVDPPARRFNSDRGGDRRFENRRDDRKDDRRDDRRGYNSRTDGRRNGRDYDDYRR